MIVPDKFNMVDMEGIDLLEVQGVPVDGLYDKLVESITLCRYQCLYNWKFNGILIPPTYVEMEVGENEEVIINFGMTVTPDDIIHLQTIEPPPAEPVIIPLLAEENMVYNVPSGVDGFDPVTVDVPSYTPVIDSLSVSQNGTYAAPSGVDGYSPITVDVPSQAPVINSLSVTQNGTYTAPSGVDGYSPITVNVPASQPNNYYNGTSLEDFVKLSNSNDFIKQIGTNVITKVNDGISYAMVGISTLGYYGIFSFSNISRDNANIVSSAGSSVVAKTETRSGVTWYCYQITGLSGDLSANGVPLDHNRFSGWDAIRQDCLDMILQFIDSPEGFYYMPAQRGVVPIPTGYSGFANLFIT